MSVDTVATRPVTAELIANRPLGTDRLKCRAMAIHAVHNLVALVVRVEDAALPLYVPYYG